MNPFKFAARYTLSLASCLYLFTLGFLRERNRRLLHQICVHFGLARPPPPEPPGPPTLIPKARVESLVPDETELLVLEPTPADGNVSPFEMIVINSIVRHRPPKVCFEIGTFDGRTTLNLAANGPADGRVYTLDLPREGLNATQLPIESGDRPFVNKPHSGERFRGTKYEARITQLYGDSATFDFGPYAGGVDLVFIDGSHAHDYVLADTKTALRLLRNGRGVILWHDYSSVYWKGLTRALNELFEQEPRLRGMKHVEGTTLVAAFLD